MTWLGDVWMQFDTMVHTHLDMDVRGIAARELFAPALIELSKVVSFNMFDHDLAIDVGLALDAVRSHVSALMIDGRIGSPYLMMQGAGPHFCPGGNPTPLLRSCCASGWCAMCASYLLSQAIMRIREMSSPVVASVHGFVVGGGVACMLHTDVRVAPSSTTFSFGNVSRGHVPIMLLSKRLP
jgi:2-(1,2-epoxy-1,2-dihydrophenyl)acetyl-CoA isomerase